MKPSPDLAWALMTVRQRRQYGCLPAKEAGGRKRAWHSRQVTEAAWKRAADLARLGDGASWATAVTHSMLPVGMRARSGWPGGKGRAAAKGTNGVAGGRGARGADVAVVASFREMRAAAAATAVAALVVAAMAAATVATVVVVMWRLGAGCNDCGGGAGGEVMGEVRNVCV